MDFLARTLNTTTKTKSFTYYLSSAIQFGLMKKEKDEYEITPLGNSVLYPPNGEYGLSEDRKIAFKNPPFYKRLVEQYKDLSIPDFPILRNVFQNMGIVPSVLDEAVNAFLESARLAGVLTEDNRLVLDGGVIKENFNKNKIGREATLVESDPIKNITPFNFSALQSQGNNHYIEFRTQKGENVKLIIPTSIDKEDIERLCKMLEILVKKE